MSMYNLMHGVDHNSAVALAMLELTPGDVGRFRDAWIEEDGKHISVFTRNGGGNRDEYQDVFDELAKHPCYLGDQDDDFDCTYATIRFSVPNKYLDLANRLKPKETIPSLWQKTQSALRSIEQSVVKQKENEANELIGKMKATLAEVMKIEKEEKP